MSSDRRETIVLKKFVVGPLETNCYLVVDRVSRKGMLIDPGFPSREIENHIRSEKIEVIGILNTHGHADHILGNRSFGYPIMIHELDEPFLCDSSKNLSLSADMSVECGTAQRILADGDIIELGSLEFEVIHTPGHTPGGISVRCGEYLFAGDTLFFEGVGRTDLPGGNTEQLRNSITNRLFTLPDTVKVFPGHGPATTIGHEKQFNPYL